MLKKILLSISFIVLLKCFGFCANEIYQNVGQYYDLGTSTSTAVTISSYTITTFSAVNEGVHRIFRIAGDPSATLYFQVGGSTTTVLTNGLPLDAHVYYIEDKYFGDIYFTTDTGNVNLRAAVVRRQS